MYNPIDEYVDISDHIEFAESLINKYEWDCETERRLVSQLQLINDKQKDKCLNLSVVGEFSTGKSSFINALLGENLLVSSIVQGTTVVNTIIEYYAHPVLYIQKKDGTRDVVNAQSIEELRRGLSDVTTNSSSARNIELVRVGLPSELLANGIRIIDTPGTNSIESWHEEVTKEAIKNLSDLSIILTDAIHPLPQTLIDFIDENLVDIYTQCAFIVTYYDKVRKSERESLLHYVERRLTQELEMSEPKVFPFIAPAVISDKAGEIIMSEQSEMVRISLQSQKRMLILMGKNRQISKIKKLLALTKEAYDILQTDMESQRVQLEQEYKLLLKTKQTSLGPFIEAEKKRCLFEFSNNADDVKDNFNSVLDKRILEAKNNVLKSVMSHSGTTADSIKVCVSQDVPKEFERQVNKILKSTIVAMNQSLLTFFLEIMESYKINFEEQFNGLKIIRIDMRNIKPKKPRIKTASLSNFKNSLDYLATESSKENWCIGGGAATGAIAGAAFGGPIGAAIGGLIGAFVGAFGTTSTEELKKKACEKLSGQLDSAFLLVESDIISTFNNNVSIYKEAITREINQYLEKYKSAVDRKVAEHNSLIESNKKYSEQIMADLELILLRQRQLQSISDSFNK